MVVVHGEMAPSEQILEFARYSQEKQANADIFVHCAYFVLILPGCLYELAMLQVEAQIVSSR
jgi:hypothetical protein